MSCAWGWEVGGLGGGDKLWGGEAGGLGGGELWGRVLVKYGFKWEPLTLSALTVGFSTS